MLASKAAAVGLAMSCAACSLALDFDAVSAEAFKFRCSKIVPKPRFCDDFDANEQPFERWTALQQHNGTTNLDTTAFVSPGRSFLATSKAFKPGDTDVTAQALAVISLPELKDKPVIITVSFDFRVDRFDSASDGYVTLLSFDYNRDSGGHLVGVDLLPTAGLSLALSEESIADDNSDPMSMLHGLVAGDALAEATWYHVEFQLDIREPKSTDNWFTLRIDGEARKTDKLKYPLAGGTPEFALGIAEISDATINPWHLRYDDFVVQVKAR